MPGLFDRLFKNDKTASVDSTKLLFTAGAVINQRYRLEAEIARGGMGIIFRAYDLTEKREVAFKVINPETANALSLGQFSREMEILSKLNHPNIVYMLQTGFVNEDPRLPFLVMEFLHGKPLSDIGGLTIPRIVSIAKQICETLAYIHERGFVYRDLKPNNILLEKRGFVHSVKLVDFGLSRPLGETYQPNESSLAGTVFYLAPELIAGQLADVRSDLYALGILLYEMIVGRVPFSDIDEAAIQLQHQQQKASLPSQSRPDVPMELDTLVSRLLEKNPQDRPVSAQEVLEILNSIRFDKIAQGNLPPNIPDRTDTQPVIQLIAEHSLVTFADDDLPLALSSASRLAGQFSEGVWVVEMGQIQDPTEILPVVCSTLGVKENPNRPPVVALIEYLREKNLLLILSHCGHVLSACTQLVTTILESCPDVRILAISEKPLGIPAEKYLEV